jgi:hypothetical protein
MVNPEITQVGEIRRTQSPKMMLLREEYFFGRAFHCSPRPPGARVRSCPRIDSPTFATKRRVFASLKMLPA